MVDKIKDEIKKIESHIDFLKKSIEQKTNHMNNMITNRKKMLEEVKSIESTILQQNGALLAYQQAIQMINPFVQDVQQSVAEVIEKVNNG